LITFSPHLFQNETGEDLLLPTGIRSALHSEDSIRMCDSRP
jgi:hypothetical protein